MLGFLLIYFIGKKFYDLAFEYDKKQWPYAIAGVAIYYAGIMFGAILFGAVTELYPTLNLDTLPGIVQGLFFLPVGILFCWGFYRILINRWQKQNDTADVSDTLDGNLK